MTKHKLDQLFKHKLEHLEAVPSATAFEKFNARINGRKRGYWYYLAASVSLALTITVSWWLIRAGEVSLELSDEPGYIGKDIFEGQASREMAIQSPPDTKGPVKEEDMTNHDDLNDQGRNELEASQTELNNQPAKNIALVDEIKSEPRPGPEEILQTIDSTIETNPLDGVELPVGELIATTGEVDEEIVEKPLPVVTIIYKSGKKNKEKLLAEKKMQRDSSTVKEGALNKIFNSARSLADGSLIADLRDAKENFFNKNDD